MRKLILNKRYLGILVSVFLPMLGASQTQANIYEWAYVNPSDPSQGVYQSTMVCPGGSGVSAVSGANLDNLNLTQAYLIEVNLTNGGFNSATLTNADLTNANLTTANLSSATLTNATLTGADLNTANLTNANLSSATLTNATLTSADLYTANLTNANLTNAYLDIATLTNANLTGATVAGADFGALSNLFGSNLTASQLYSTASYKALNLQGIGLEGNSLANNNLTGWNFSGQNLTNANLSYATLTNLAGADLTSANLSSANLSSANVSSATLTNATLTNANLSSANLTNAKLVNANLTSANLSYANLTSANLSSADLSSAYLTNANLFSATLTSTNLTGADLRGAQGFVPGSATTTNTVLPDGTIQGLYLDSNNPTLLVRNYSGNIPIRILQGVSINPGTSLVIQFDSAPWGSTISFASGIPVTLGGNLALGVANGIDATTLFGRSFQVFNWSGVIPSGQFNTVNHFSVGCLLDLSQVYSTGNLTVLGHAAPSLDVVSGNNQRVIVGATGISAGLSLSNGTPGQSGLASLDVNSLGTGVSGPTGGELVASGSSQAYTAALSTSSLGLQTQTFSLNVGDDHTLPGASAPQNLSTSATLTVVANRIVTASTTDYGLVHVGSAVSQPITLSTSGDDNHFTRVSVGNAGPDANGISVTGGANPVFNDSSVTDQRTLGGVFNTVGTINGSITLPTTGEGLVGEAPINVPVNYLAQVYSGQAEWNATTGAWGTSANWKDTLGGGPSGPPGLSGYATDTATFGPTVLSGTATAALDGAAPVLSNLIFSNSNASYMILQGTGTTGLTLSGTDGSSPAAVTVISGKHWVEVSILLGSNLVVSDSGSLGLSGNLSDGGLAESLTLAGGGELILSGNNTYTGRTNVTAGTLIITSNTALPDGTSLTVGADGTFIFDPSPGASSVAVSPGVVAVPEPSTLVLLGVGAIGWLGYGWRRRRQPA